MSHHAYLANSDEDRFPSVSDREYCVAPAAITANNPLREITSTCSMNSEESEQDINPKLQIIDRNCKATSRNASATYSYYSSLSDDTDAKENAPPGAKYANDTNKGKLYMRLSKFEQCNIMGDGDLTKSKRRDVHLWLYFTFLVLLYATLGGLNVVDVVVDQGMWRSIDIFSTFNILAFGFGLAFINLMTYILASLDKQEKSERASIVLDDGHVIPSFGRLAYDDERQQFYEVHLLNPALVRFILYLDFFWIINGCICSIAAVVYWGCFYSQEPCRIITYIYTFLPLPMFIILLCKRKSLFMRMALAAYWPSDLTRESGRFNGKIGEIAGEHFASKNVPEELAERFYEETTRIYNGLTTRQNPLRNQSHEDQLDPFGLRSRMMSADEIEEAESQQGYRISSKKDISDLEQGRY